MDAKVNHPKTDINGKTCAIIKVESGAERGFSFDTGTVSITETVQKPGQIWLYVSPGIRKLNIYHEEYKACYYDLPISVAAGNVYSLNLKLIGARSKGTFIETVTVTSGYFKIRTTPAQSVVYLGKTKEYELDKQMTSSDGSYSRMLEYGEYFYKVESDYCETYEGKVLFNESTPRLDVALQSAYNNVVIESLPESGANVVITGLDSHDDDKGKTPFSPETKFSKGRYKVTLMHPDYAYFEQIITLDGDGTTKDFSFEMTPQYAEVTCVCESPKAEIWVDDEYKGVGSWTGRVSGSMQHKLEVRLENHHSQSKAFSLENGRKETISIGAPVQKFALLDITSTPSFSRVTVNGEDFGEAPILKKVALGSCAISAYADGYETWSTNIDILEEGKTYSVKAALNPVQVMARPEVKLEKRDPAPKAPASKEVSSSNIRFQQIVSIGSGWMGNLSEYGGMSVNPISFDYLAGVRVKKFFIGAGAAICHNNIKLKPDYDIELSEVPVSFDLKACAGYYFLKNSSRVNPFLSASLIYGIECENLIYIQNEYYNADGKVVTGGLAWSACFGLDIRLKKSFGLTINAGVRNVNVGYDYSVEDVSSGMATQKVSESVIIVPMASIGLTF